MGIEFFEYISFGIPDAMWQPTWSPHPPPGAQGAPLGQSAGPMALPPQGVQPHALVAQPMNQQWMGNPTGSQGCPGNSPTLGPTSFYGPGHPGQGFVVQCKHHQGCYSIMQHQQPMLGTTSSSSPPPMGFGLGSQQAGYQGTTWSPFPTPTPLPQQVPQQHQLDTTSNPQGHNPGTLSSPTPQPSSFTSFPPQPNQSFQHQPRPCLQTNIPVATSPLAQNLQGVQGQPALPGVQGQPALQVPQLPQGSPGLQSAPGPPVCQDSQVAQGQQTTQVPPSCSRSYSKCSYPARNTSGTDEWKPTHEPGAT